MEALKSIGDYFLKGGLVMWPLLLCSIAVVTIAIERYLFYKEADSGNLFADNFCEALDHNNLGKALEVADAGKGECARIVASALRLEGNVARKSTYMEAQAGLAIAKLREKLGYLGIIVTMAPLLGLLGTIVGMINSFSIFNLQAGQPMAITGGIGEALIATATGLCVAILSLAVHSYFAQKLDTAITNMEQCFSAILDFGSRGE
ncbi:MAG TPA: MotA/TolQ/ExbB proton channel family protein [Candidatus Avacidaminococcus intestinavium]|uniref:MotA/TolQ/ExbB proton channel family protein n=1 Tax=Candidatus Avacidaminococcus intestinavium TaxID=2840684 RepID=A0A9D1MR32_9FIRM|nr:MotA/TolQ/ExbB proton channel family protein [Candidatus Avacidaminococcus intestinavium]